MTQICVRIGHMTTFKIEGSQCGLKADDGSRDAMSMAGCGGKQAGLIPTPNMALGKIFSRSVVRRSTYLLLRHAFALLAKAFSGPYCLLGIHVSSTDPTTICTHQS